MDHAENRPFLTNGLVSKVGTAIKVGLNFSGASACLMTMGGMISSAPAFMYCEMLAKQANMTDGYSKYGPILSSAGKDLVFRGMGQNFLVGAAVVGTAIAVTTAAKAFSYYKKNHSLNGFADSLGDDLVEFMKSDADRKAEKAEKATPPLHKLEALLKSANEELAELEFSAAQIRGTSQDLTRKIAEVKARRQPQSSPEPSASAPCAMRLG